MIPTFLQAFLATGFVLSLLFGARIAIYARADGDRTRAQVGLGFCLAAAVGLLLLALLTR
jgi:hypothetical protein